MEEIPRKQKPFFRFSKNFKKEHHLEKVTVVADAAMLSRTNLEALVANDYHFVVGSRLTKIPYDIAQFKNRILLVDNQIIDTKKDDYRIIYQYREKELVWTLKTLNYKWPKPKEWLAAILH